LLGSVSCFNKGHDLIKMEYFSFEASSTRITQQSNPKCSGYFILATDTIYYNAGNNMSTLTEQEPVVTYVQPGHEHSFSVPPGVYRAKSPQFDLDDFRKQNVFFKEVAGVKGKLILPRVDGVGVTGLYVDSLTHNEGGKVSFNMYGTNLSTSQQETLVGIFESIRFDKNLILCDTHTVY
jgi:hypothetical protein